MWALSSSTTRSEGPSTGECCASDFTDDVRVGNRSEAHRTTPCKEALTIDPPQAPLDWNGRSQVEMRVFGDLTTIASFVSIVSYVRKSSRYCASTRKRLVRMRYAVVLKRNPTPWGDTKLAVVAADAGLHSAA